LEERFQDTSTRQSKPMTILAFPQGIGMVLLMKRLPSATELDCAVHGWTR